MIRSSDFIVGSSSLNITTVPGLVTIYVVVLEIMFVIHHVARAILSTCLKGYVTLWVEASHSDSAPCQVW